MDCRLRITNYLYRASVFAYPIEFRRRYAAEMASVFEENCADAFRKGALALAGLYCASVYDLLVNVVATHTSRFLSNFKSDLRLISKSPAFAAAFGALVGNLFSIQEVVFGPPFGLRKTVQERLVLLGIASINIATLWLAGVLFSLLFVHTVSKAQFLLLKNRLRAFRRLASIGMLLALGTAAKLLISRDARSMKLTTTAVPAVGYWVGYPVLLMTIILIIFLLQPLLTLRSSETTEDFLSAERPVK